MDISNIASQINLAAEKYQISNIQKYRSSLHAKRPRTYKIFSQSTIFDEYAPHSFRLAFNRNLSDARKTWINNWISCLLASNFH